jgi:hypothetical protein
MPREYEKAVLKLVKELTSGAIIEQSTSGCEWLTRLGPVECGKSWSLICDIYSALTNQVLPEPMPPLRKRQVDAVLQLANSVPRIIEVDEAQHFNPYRAATFRFYPPAMPLAFDRNAWIDRSQKKERLETGNFDKPAPPLFDLEHGRHRQRAFYDALCDILPPDHDFLPTRRIAYFEVTCWDKENKTWFDENDARKKVKGVLVDRKILS